MGTGIGMFRYADFGLDPFNSLVFGISKHLPFDYGSSYVLASGALLIAAVAFDRKRVGLGTLLNMFFAGYVVEATCATFNWIISPCSIYVRITLLSTGMLFGSFGCALYFISELGVSVYDDISLNLSDRMNLNFKNVRIACDFTCLVVGLLLGSPIGLGTAVAVAAQGPLISLIKRNVERGLSQRLKSPSCAQQP